MTDNQIKLVIGSMLHDIGKVVYRTGDGRNHSESGYDFVKSESGLGDESILQCVRYHHSANLRRASLQKDSPAYITCFADNIAAAVDRREGDNEEYGFDKSVPLESVFNILNGNKEKKHFKKMVLDVNNGINNPTDEDVKMDDHFYQSVIMNIKENLRTITLCEDSVNSLLSVLEANLSYVPSSTARKELTDISLFDHVKMTAAFASCVQLYCEEKGISDYENVLFRHADKAYAEEMFRLYSMDVSGIQKFIYSIPGEGALRELRGRSFYLEILMENTVDELLCDLQLSRANLIYSGGGHCYILVPNTGRAMEVLNRHEKKTNEWFVKWFGTELYIASGSKACSAETLQNRPVGSYAEIYRSVSAEISRKKLHRYSASDILALNARQNHGERECKSCRRVMKLNGDDRCPICASLHRISNAVLYNRFFVVTTEKEENALPLPDGRYLLSVSDEKKLTDYMLKSCYVRSYSKNILYTGKNVTTKLWTGDYTTGDSFEEFAQKAEGIERIAVLRADVDNLGQTFVAGFDRAGANQKYVTLSRTATLSRQLSLFFKCYINEVLRNGKYDALGKAGERFISIVYSGGDDVFLVGSWNEVVSAFADIKNAFEVFCQKTLTISGGIGIYPAKFPVNIMAKETELLENASKQVNGKNAITLFTEEMAFPWSEFLNEVMGEKFRAVKDYFTVSNSRGKAFLYHLLDLIRNDKDRINMARFVYLLSRMEPETLEDAEQKSAYTVFSEKMYTWVRRSEKDKKELIMAIYLYVYLIREREEHNDY